MCPWKPNILCLAARRMRAVATGQVGGPTYFQTSVRPFQMRLDTPARLFEIHPLRATLDVYSNFRQPINEQTLVLSVAVIS
jgi:hypothetical protein